MKRYKSHKVVEAAKIVGFRTPNGTSDHFELVFKPEETHSVPAAWVEKHADLGQPESLVGGYFVRYADGYESWSPAEAFENGYTEMNGAECYGSFGAPPAEPDPEAK